MSRQDAAKTGESPTDRGDRTPSSRRRFLKAAAATGVAVTGLGTGVASAAVTDATLTVEGTETGTVGHDATVDHRPGHATVRGTVPVPDPCHSVALGEVALADGRLSVSVESVRDADEDTPCPGVVATVDYVVDVAYEGDVSSVVVEHAAGEGWRRTVEVGTATPATRTTRPSTATAPGTTEAVTTEAVTTEPELPGTTDPGRREPIDETSLTVEEVVDGSADGAVDVSLAGTTVTVDGALGVGTPCHVAAFDEVRVQDGTLYVSVRPVETGADGCVEVLATVEYFAEVTLAERPSRVVVEHAGADSLRREFDLDERSGPISLAISEFAVADTAPTSIELSWRLVGVGAPNTTPLDHVNVYVDGELDHRVHYYADSDADPVMTSVQGLDPGTTYEVAVAPVGADGSEGDPRSVSATTDPAPATTDEGTTRPTYTPPGTTRTTTAANETEGTPGRVGANTALPGDPDDDGRFEDVNGNDRRDIADAVDLFQHRDDVDPAFFDFNGSGGVEIGDAVSLFRENAG